MVGVGLRLKVGVLLRVGAAVVQRGEGSPDNLREIDHSQGSHGALVAQAVPFDPEVLAAGSNHPDQGVQAGILDNTVQAVEGHIGHTAVQEVEPIVVDNLVEVDREGTDPGVDHRANSDPEAVVGNSLEGNFPVEVGSDREEDVRSQDVAWASEDHAGMNRVAVEGVAYALGDDQVHLADVADQGVVVMDVHPVSTEAFSSLQELVDHPG